MRIEMAEAIVYVDTSEVRQGALEDLKAAIKDLADFVEANEPRIIAYNVYLSQDGTQINVVHIHPDSDRARAASWLHSFRGPLRGVFTGGAV
jgi:hypothetical protein